MREGTVTILTIVLILASSIAFLTINMEAGGSESDGVWPMLGGDPQHTGQSQFDTSDNEGGLVWSIRDIYGFPSVAIDCDGTIYAGYFPSAHIQHVMKAIYPNGTLKWTFDADKPVQTCPAIADDGTVYFGCDDGNLYALYPNGTEKWRFGTSGELQSSPVIDDQDNIYFCSRDGKLYCVDQHGNEQWNLSTDGILWMNPALNHQGEVVFGSSNGVLYCVYPNGTLRWSSKVGNELYGTISIDDEGNIYCFDTGTDLLLAIDPEGNLRWSHPTLYDLSGASVGLDGTIYCGAGFGLVALDMNGSLKWKFETAGWNQGSPVVSSDGTIFFVTSDGNLYAVDQSGNERWRREIGPWTFASPAIGSDGTVYIATDDFDLLAFNGLPDLSPTLIACAVSALIIGIILAIWAAYPKKRI